jgi:hypothetical protein
MDEGYLKALTGKWGEFLEGIPDRSDADRYIRGCTAMLLENESQYLQNLNEDTRSTNVGSFTKFIFPILRRVFPNLIANEIVSVQPMTAPVGAVFYLDYVYGTNNGAGANQTPRVASAWHHDLPRRTSTRTSRGVHQRRVLATGNGTDYGGAGAALAVTLAWTPVRDARPNNGFSTVNSGARLRPVT